MENSGKTSTLIVAPTIRQRRAPVAVGVYVCPFCLEVHEGRTLRVICKETLAPPLAHVELELHESLFGFPLPRGSA